MPTATTFSVLAQTAALNTGTTGVSTVELTIRMVVALAVILGIITIAARLVRRHTNSRDQHGPRIVIDHQQQLNKHTTLTLLTTGTQQLLIATNPTTTTLLTTTQTPTTQTPATQTPATQTTTKPNTRIDIRTKPNPLKTLQNKTVRRA